MHQVVNSPQSSNRLDDMRYHVETCQDKQSTLQNNVIIYVFFIHWITRQTDSVNGSKMLFQHILFYNRVRNHVLDLDESIYYFHIYKEHIIIKKYTKDNKPFITEPEA